MAGVAPTARSTGREKYSVGSAAGFRRNKSRRGENRVQEKSRCLFQILPSHSYANKACVMSDIQRPVLGLVSHADSAPITLKERNSCM